MKKLLVLALVLSVATIANAGLQIAVDGIQGATTSGPASVLSIYTDSAIAVNDGGYWALVIETDKASLTGGIIAPAFDDPTGMIYSSGMSTPATDAGFVLPANENGTMVYFTNFSTGPVAAGSVLFDGFAFAATANTVISLYQTDFATYQNVVDSVVATPEPMTLGLLALGGLFLRRK